MKKTYLLIVDFFLIVNKIFLSQEPASPMIKLSGISIKEGEHGLLEAIKKPVFSKLILVLLTGLIGLSSYAQTYKTFSIREKIEIRGKMIVAGNTILGKDNLPFNDNTKANQDISMQYIDIDGDSSTFSSSSADLSVPPQKDGSATTCYKVAYAALYWGAMLQNGSRTDINKVKLKLPGATTYNDINGEVIYDAIVSPIIPDANKPYACYADVTSLLAGLTDLTGTYTVANVVSSIGSNGSTGLSAGWTLFVVYEDPTLHMKSFNVFDGFSHIYSSHFEKIPVTGFITPPSGNIDLQFAYAALDGDKPQGATKLEFGTKQVVTPLRPANNFFISTIENTNGVSTPRNPSGSNTLGYDTGVLEVIGANPEYIKHNQTSTDFTLQVAQGQADPVFAFFGAYAVDIIAPKIDLTKLVKNTSGVDVGGGNVTLGQSLTYEISYQSTGNDNVKNFTIKDVLPINITFDPATSIDYTNAGGATFQSYDPLTRTIIFNIPNTSVEVNDGIYTIRINIQVVPDCNSLTTACSNEIKNQAFATYQGVINTNVFQEEGSFASTACKLGSPESTNFLVDITNCKFTQNVILCGSSVVLKASDGYSTYLWSRNPDGSSPIGTGQTFTATQIGIYYVHNTAPSTCKDIVEEITVKYFGVTNTNPVIPYAQLPYLGEVVTCPDDGKQLPNLFLCGANDSRLIQTGISDAAAIEWYKLNEGSCVAVVNPDCANESTSCTWSLIGTGPDYTANTSGQFRLTIRYPGGCFSQFYFNVYQNLLNPTVTSKDILCTTSGQITVGGVPSGYEYSLNAAGPYQPSNVFPNASFPVINAGSYTVYIKQVGVTANPCIFSVPDILIRQRNFTVSTFLSQPLCQGDKGAVKLVANDALPQYYFSISQGATLVNSVGPITANEYEFSNLNPGIYTVRVRTDDGCDYSNSVEIIEPALLTATAAITKPLTCTDGEITVYPIGGTPPYIYYVNSTVDFQSTPEIAVTNPLPAGGIYNIVIEDSNNCTTTTSITVAAIPPPVYTMSQTDIECYNDNTGVINFNVTNANGYTLAYSIDNGVTYLPTPTFSNLFGGIYNTMVRYTLGTAVCYGTMQPITITQPSTALTASAGVSELAGCGPSGEGKVRITNPQGGTPFPAPDYYLYSFDNQATWVTTNEAYLAPGTYTLYIKDAVGCIFQMPNIIIDPEPVAPTIDVATPVFNCDGTANSTVTVTNPASTTFSYNYYIDGLLNPNTADPKTFLNVTTGSHVISVEYKLQSVSTYSNLLKEDFGSGPDVQSPGINPAFCWERQVEATKCNGDKLFGNGEYTVTKSLENNPYSGWHNPVDHTAGSATGRYLAVDAGTAIPNNAVLYRKTINDIIPNQPIQVRFFATNLLKIGNTQPDASLTVELQNSSGTPLSSSSTGGIPKTNGWVEYNKTINPGNNTTLDFVLRLEIAQVNGIDFAVDDIEVYQLPKICVTKVDFPFIVPSGKAFDASVTGFQNVSCSGANDGTITIAAQNFDATNGFQYSTNNGTSWNTQLTSPYTITGLANGTYAILIRYDATATGTCVKTFSQIITAPTPLTVTASVTALATCSTGATVTAVGAGGTLAYQYELRDAAGVAVIQPYQLNAQFTNVATGNYTVFVKDANGCVSAVGAAINVVAPPTLTATLDAGSDICFDSVNQASLVVNVSGGTSPFVYSLDGAPAQNSNTFNDVSVGNHSIIVTDSFGCTAPAITVTIAPQLTTTITNIKTLDCTASPNAVITGTITGGNAPFVVTVLSGTGSGTIAYPTATTFTYTTAVASTYQFQITDSKGCITTTTATINPLIPITATTTDVNPSCSGALDGSVQIIPSGGVGPYTYSSDGTTYVPGSLFSGLGDGTYTFYVKDSNACFITKTVTLTQPTTLVATATATAFSCTATNTKQSATITIAVPTTGTAPYQYSFNGSGYSAANTLTLNDNGADQPYTYSVRDVKGCIVSGSGTLLKLNSPIAGTITNSAITCNSTTSTVTVTPTAGTGVGTLTYEITFPLAAATSNTTGVFAGLSPDTYVFKVTDANGCYYTESHIVNPVTPIAVVGNKLSDVLCNGGNTGSIQYTVSGFSGTYSYSINGGSAITGQSATTIDLTNQSAGTYAILITDEVTGCTANASITITQPSVLVASSATATHVNCNNDDSQITVTASGGTANYTYAAVISGSTAPIASAYISSNIVTVDTNSATNLIWDVYVKDAKGCIATTTVTVISDALPTIDTPAIQCYVGSPINITITGTSVGVPTYSIGSGYQSSPNFTINAAGTYTLSLKDASGCIATTTYIVDPQLTVLPAVTKELDCTISPAATITVTAAGGKSPYSYEVSTDGGGTYAAMGTNVYSTLVAGTFQFRVTDANNCITTATTTVNPLVPITATTTNVDPSCNGALDGSVQIIPSGGVGPYTYSSDGIAYVPGSLFSGLADGTYTFYVKDSRECFITETVILTQPTALLASATATAFSCSATNTKQSATITIAVPTTGTAPYQYSFNGGGYSAANTLTLNDNGLDQPYTYSVRDSKGCIASGSGTLLKLDSPTDLSFTAAPITCTATTTTVTATAANGVGALTYAITFPLAAATSNTTGIFAGLSPDTYIFKVTDANGCYYTESHIVNPVTPIAVIATKLTDVDCFGNTTGSISYNVSGFATTYSYSINSAAAITGQTAAVFTLPNLGAATYDVVFTDEVTDCTAPTSIIINEPANPLSAIYTIVNANCFTPTSQVTVTPAGGTASYTYAYKQDGVAPIATDYVASNIANLNPTTNANWDVWIKDANGCTIQLDVVITTDPVPAVTASATGQCLGVGSYTITATGSGGTGTLNYSINAGASYQAGNTFVVATTGSYTIRVKDANGCTADSAPVVVAQQLTLSAVLNKDITCNPAPTAAQITITATGGTGPFTYESEVSGAYTAMASNVFNSSVAGSYTFRVTDANGCTAITTTAIVITAPINPEITSVTQTQTINCNGDATAAISIAIDNTKGQAPFVFNVYNNTLSIDYGTQTSGLRAGSYTIMVTDAKGCTDTFPYVINEPLPLAYTYIKNEIICSGSGTTLGSIIATPTGGTAPYTYSITNNVGATVDPPTISGGVYTFDIVNFGIYELSFVDANGCSYKQVITMASPPNDLIINVNNGAPSCTSSTIEITVNPSVIGGPYHFALFPIISGSTPSYEYASNMGSYQNANDGNILNPGYLQSTFIGLNPGVIYSFIVYDEATNCYYFKQAESPTLTASTLTSTVTPNNVKCKGAADGTVDFTFTNTYPVSTDVTYQIFNSQTNLPTSIPIGTVTGLNGTVTTPINGLGLLGTGTYYILFKEISSGANNGCTNASATFTISESPVDLSITANAIKNANCTEDGIIAAQAQGGTAPYTYQVTSSATAPLASDGSWVSGNTFNRAGTLAGTLYYVYAKDAYGCIKQDTETVFKDEDPTITSPVVPICYDGSTPFTINILGTVDPDIIGGATYSVNGSAFQTSPSFTFNAAGTYNLVIKDGNGCTANSNYEVYPQLNLAAALTKELDCTATPNAEITLTTTGGNTTPSANYTYEVSFNSGAFAAASNPYTATTAGIYDFRVTDANNPTLCQATTTFTLDPIVPTVFPLPTPTDVSCFGGTDGTITVDVTSGVGPYEYQLDAGTFQTSNVFTGLAAGTTYVITVKDANSCLYPSAPITITEPVILTATSAITTPLTCGAGNAAQPATVTVNGVDGTAPYVYSFDLGTNYSSANTYQSYVGTTFDVLVKDANGCLYTLVNGVNIPALVPPADLDFVSTAVTCLALTSDVTLTTTNGIGTLSYEILSPASATSNVTGASSGIFTGLSPDTYLFQVTDANFCTYQESYTVDPVTNITVSGQLVSDVTCNPGSNGEVLFTVGNFTGTYSYTINGALAVIGQSSPTITVSGLTTASTQTIIVTDETTGCTATTFIDVVQPAALALVANPFINANCNFDAQVSVTASGGVAPYSYSYVISGAPAGTYSASASAVLDPAMATSWDVYVKDANNCVITTPLPITIATDALPIIVMPASQCFVGVPLTIDLSIGETVAVGPATYAINGSNQTSPIYTINAPGTYQLSIVDANGCSSNVVDYIVQPQLLLNAALTKELDCTTSPDAVVTLTAGGGTTSYTLYEYSTNAGASYTAMGSNVLTTLTAGSYIFRVTDTQGCQAVSSEVTVTPQTTPTFTFTPTNVSCNGGSDGSIVITAANGIAPYQYSIDNGATYQTSNVFTGLTDAGVYNIVIKDAKECTSVAIPVDITQPTAVSGTAVLTQGLTCGAGNATQSALVTVTGSGGTGSYEYSFDGGVNYTATNTYSTNVSGMVTAYIKDANGCISAVPATVNVPALNPPTNLDFVATAVTCLALTSDVTLTTTNGVGALSYVILSPASATSNVTGASSGIFTGLLPDTYLFQVTDANFCTYQESFTVNPVTNITVSGQLISEVTCNPGANGEVLFTVANFAGTYTYSINGGSVSAPQSNPTITVSGLSAASTQTIVVTDVITGCTATTSINVAQSAPLALVANPFVNANCNFGAQVSVTASGGVAPYSYSYVPSGTPVGTYSTSASTVLDPAMATSWDVYVKDANNCVITTPLPITIATDPLPSGITVSGLSQCPSAAGDYTFTVNVATGMAPYEFSIGSGFQTSPTFTVNAPGTYDVIVKDANGCSTTATGLVVILPALQLQADITALPSCTDGDGTLTLLASGGSGNYEYNIDSGTYQASANFTNIFAGTHTLTVRDITTNCTKAIPVTFGAATPITGFALSKTDVTCYGGNDGTITATMSLPAVGVNDNPIYTYSIDGGATTQTSAIFSGLIAGTYTVGVTSGRGCVATQTITVIEPAIITVPAPTVAQFGCNSGSNAMNFATITVTGVTGGSGVYTNYEFLKGGTKVQFGASNVYTEANLLGGSYTVNVYDDKGCLGTTTAAIVINPFIALDKVNIAVNNAITCVNLEDITVSASSIGGTPTNLQYTVADSNATTGVIGANYNFTNATGVFTGLNIGNYLITVENLDTGCSIQDVHYVSNPNTFDLNITNIVDVTCFGGTNGTANVTIIDRTITATNPDQAGPFSYTIVDALGNPVSSGTSPNAGPFTINTLASGTYSITGTLTNSPYCGVTKNFTINQPNAALTIAETHTAITCISGNNDGSISASAVGGWPGGYEFQLELGATIVTPWSTVTNFSGLTQGTYTVRVRDTKGCSVFVDVLLSNPTPIVFTASSSAPSVSCFGDKNASITVSLPTGGQGSNYLYTLNTTSIILPTTSGPQASPLFSGLGAGTYTITVSDGWGCSATSSTPMVIAEPSVVTASLVVTTTQTCNNLTTLTLSAVGGTPPYTYSADGVIYNATTFNPSVTFPVAVGTHHYYVKDANGCISYVSNDIKIDPLPALVINLDLSNAVVNCPGDATGVIVATAQGGLGNYIYTLQDASGNPLPAAVQSSPGVFTQLVAGGYKVQVSSLDCSTTSALITVTEPSTPLTATYVATDATCNGANNGTITINASGGTGIIKYAISPRLDQFFVSNKFELLQPGFYEIIAQDQNGCYIHTLGIEIQEPTLIIPSVDPLTIIPEMCFGDNDGAFIVDITGGTMPYSVSLDNINGPFISGTATQTQFDFTGLAGGNHIVYIRDANLCNAELEVPLPASVKLNPNAIIDYGCLNNSPSLTVTVTIDSSITNPADVDYALDGSGSYQASNVFTNLSPGIHHITARHTNGCEKDTPDFEILQIDPLTLVLTDGGLNEIVATATGGGGGYQFTLNGESMGSQNTFIFYRSGDYTVTVTDSNGCVATATRYFEFVDIKIPNVFTPNGDGDNDGWTPTNTINYPDLVFHVFDRYGRKVGTYREGQFWDGKYNGKELPTGDYWYVLKLQNEQDSREFVGHFTLYR